MEGWYIAKTKPQKETTTVNFLSQCDVQVFYPKVVSPGHNGAKSQALFPTYLFCHLDPESVIWPKVRWAPGMSYFLSCDGEPAPVPDTLVDYLRLRVSQWNDLDQVRRLSQGERVVITGGPFTGLEGIFQRYMGAKQRCMIFLDVVGRLINVELSAWEVAEAASTMPKH